MSDVESIACKNVSGPADFDGNGFTDCAASPPFINGTTGQAPFPNVNVLLNLGTAATSCASGTGVQFQAALNYVLNFPNFTGIGSILVGQLDGGTNADLTLAAIDNSGSTNSDSFVSAFSGAGGFGADNSSITSSASVWAVDDTQFGLDSRGSERSAALLDCNNDQALDVAMLVGTVNPLGGPGTLNVNILQNNGSGLQDIIGAAASFDVGLGTIPDPSSNPIATLTIADFDGQNGPDIAVAINDQGGGNAKIGVCLNDGNCGFSNCPASFQVDLTTIHPGASPGPLSIAAGDFNDDGNADVVIAEDSQVVNTQGVHYFFGNGVDAFTSDQHVDYNTPGDQAPQVITTGCFNNDNVVDVAFTYGNSDSVTSNVGVITSDGSGGLHAPISLSFVDDLIFAHGIDAADFDNAGGDDIIALGQNQTNQSNRTAYVFMNSIETLSAIAGADQTAQISAPLAISGGSCAVSPEISGDPAHFAVQWTITGSPAGSTPTLGGATTLTPTFQSASPGAYTLQLQCLTGCNRTAIDTKTVTVAQVIPTPSPTAVPVPFTEGGCLANLTPGAGSAKGAYLLALLMPGLFCWRRWNKSN